MLAYIQFYELQKVSEKNSIKAKNLFFQLEKKYFIWIYSSVSVEKNLNYSIKAKNLKFKYYYIVFF